MKLSFFVSTIFIAVYLVFFIFSTFIVFFVYVFVCLGQLLAQFKNTALLSCPLYMHMYMFLCFIHGQINDDDDDDDDDELCADK